LWIVTRGAQRAGGAAPDPTQAPLWGLGRVIALEQPEVWGGLIDLAPESTVDSDVDALLEEVLRGDGEDQVARRAQARLVPRLVPAAVPVAPAYEWKADGSYLVTGGLGGLGLKIARWMAEHGAGSLTLVGRRGLPDRAQWGSLPPGSREAAQVSEIEAIESLGTAVHVVAADVADVASMQGVIAEFGRDRPPLRGVVHAAAALTNWSIVDMPQQALAEMLRPKISGTVLLHELTRAVDLDFFVLFSSTTGLWGSRDLAHYAAANHFLDAFAEYRRALGLPAISIDWGTWDEMRVASEQERAMVASLGMEPMPSDQALQILGHLLRADRSQIAVASVDWDILKSAYEARRHRPFLSLVTPHRKAAGRRQTRTTDRSELLQKLESVPDDDRYGVVVEYLCEEVARTLGIPATQITDVSQGLFDMGMDSLMSVELKGHIEAAVGCPMPSTLTFNYPSIQALAEFLTVEVLAADTAATETAEHVEPATTQPLLAAKAAAAPDRQDLSEDELAAMLAARLGR
jgi:acyl carrier protein/NADP-dependent 3-hydroxy acid dehydrogenase YdfG